MEFKAIISKEDLEEYIDIHFEGSYYPEIQDITLKNGEVIVTFIMGERPFGQ